MKILLVFSLISICSPFLVRAQNGAPANNTSTYIHCTRFFVSKPIKDLPDYKPEGGGRNREEVDKARRKVQHTSKILQPAKDYYDPIRQTSMGSKVGINIAPIVNFEGMEAYIYDPPDPNGAVGNSDYVETVNSTYAVYDKSGNAIIPTKDLGDLWPIGNNADGDPVALYDKFADRWFISEFQDTAAPCQLWVAVSQTNDPTGSYYCWEFSLGNTDPDYPKYAIWSDGYYVTFQGFNFNSGSPNVPQQIAVLERNRMLNGSPSAGLILANMPSSPTFMGGNNSLFSAPKVLDCDASALPPYGTPDYVVFFENKAAGGYSNSIIMDSLVVDTTAHTFRVAKADSFAVPTFNSYFSNGSYADISQPGDSHGVDALDGTFNFRVPYMKFTGYNSVVLSNTVNLGPDTVAGIRWYELRQNNTTGIWSIYQDGTYAPNDGTSRWNGAICQDYDGNIALAYSVASSSVYPGIRYTGRLVSDPLGQMTFAEQTAIAGTSTLSGTSGRWGDYSELDIDPADGLTFWATNEYGASSDNYTQLNRIFSFRLSNALGINEVENQVTVKVYQNGSLLTVKTTGLPGNDELVVNLFDISGRQLTTQTIAPVNNMFETQINVGSLAKGVYFVQLGKVNFQKVVKTEIN